ncbi:MAG: DUF2953 domain-containing protein [Clostridiales bacterium]|nr:DUF2953 domain-containing protein [Clostridiales bacterium]
MIYFFIAMVIIVAILCFSGIQMEIKIEINNASNYCLLIIRLLWGLVPIRFNFSLATLGKGAFSLLLRKTSDFDRYASMEEILSSIIKHRQKNIKNTRNFINLVSKTTINEFNFDLQIGLEDAAQTAIVYGLIISVFSSLKGNLIEKFGLQRRKICIRPYFEGNRFDMFLDCIINIKLGHIIITGIKMLIDGIKGGEISGRTSY